MGYSDASGHPGKIWGFCRIGGYLFGGPYKENSIGYMNNDTSSNMPPSYAGPEEEKYLSPKARTENCFLNPQSTL